jgi:hypothetical protein
MYFGFPLENHRIQKRNFQYTTTLAFIDHSNSENGIYSLKILIFKEKTKKCGTLSRSENFANIEQNLNL